MAGDSLVFKFQQAWTAELKILSKLTGFRLGGMALLLHLAVCTLGSTNGFIQSSFQKGLCLSSPSHQVHHLL